MFRAKIGKNVYPGKPQFSYIKVGRKGVFVIRTCFHDVLPKLLQFNYLLLKRELVFLLSITRIFFLGGGGKFLLLWVLEKAALFYCGTTYTQ